MMLLQRIGQVRNTKAVVLNAVRIPLGSKRFRLTPSRFDWKSHMEDPPGELFGGFSRVTTTMVGLKVPSDP